MRTHKLSVLHQGASKKGRKFTVGKKKKNCNGTKSPPRLNSEAGGDPGWHRKERPSGNFWVIKTSRFWAWCPVGGRGAFWSKKTGLGGKKKGGGCFYTGEDSSGTKQREGEEPWRASIEKKRYRGKPFTNAPEEQKSAPKCHGRDMA